MGVLSHRRDVLARLRSDLPHHAGGRRRSGVARRPPDAELVLRLQRTIGNRATTRLLRKTDALKRAGITTDSLVDDQTPKWIQAALVESQKLRPYLRNKFPGSAITAKGKFEIHTREDDFNQVAHTLTGDGSRMTKDQRTAAYGKVGGVFDRGSGVVHVRSRTKFGNAVHEAMHRVAHPGFHGFWGEFINEGVTQYFADCLLREQDLPIVTNHDYKKQLACAQKLVTVSSFEAVASAYFQMDNNALHDAVMKHLKMDINQLLDARKAKTVCTLL